MKDTQDPILRNNILYKQEDIFSSKMQTIVNTINCKGVMGKGLAKQFKEKFPEMYRDYQQRCEKKQVKTGMPYVWRQGKNNLEERWVLNFPTKDDWRRPSKLEWIIEGMEYFVAHYKDWGIKSIAFPALGCNLGGLSWIDVQPIMHYFLQKTDIPVEIYKPKNLTKMEKGLIEMFKRLKSEFGNKLKGLALVRSFFPPNDYWVNWKKATNATLLAMISDPINKRNILNELLINDPIKVIITNDMDFFNFQSKMYSSYSIPNDILIRYMEYL